MHTLGVGIKTDCNNIPKDIELWDGIYSGLKGSDLYNTDQVQSFLSQFEQRMLKPFHLGGHPRGYVHGLAYRRLSELIQKKTVGAKDVTILDVGSGLGDLAVYLAVKNPDLKVIGIDVSNEAKKWGETLARKFSVQNAYFLWENISNTSLPSESIDFIIGFGSFHHFIKDRGVSGEVKRILKKDGRGFFVDPCHDNYAYKLFHNKKLMKELGDEVMTRKKIRAFWGEDFEIDITPTDWAVMVDKLILYCRKRFFKKKEILTIQLYLSKVLFYVDRYIEHLPRVITTCIAGSIITALKLKSSD
jgi:ubiquinone/menaquinone biosynthesis C-methylase UbiE